MAITGYPTAIRSDPDRSREDEQDDEHDEVGNDAQGAYALLRDGELVGAQQDDASGVGWKPVLHTVDEARVATDLLQDLAEVERDGTVGRTQDLAVVLDECDQPAVRLLVGEAAGAASGLALSGRASRMRAVTSTLAYSWPTR